MLAVYLEGDEILKVAEEGLKDLQDLFQGKEAGKLDSITSQTAIYSLRLFRMLLTGISLERLEEIGSLTQESQSLKRLIDLSWYLSRFEVCALTDAVDCSGARR